MKQILLPSKENEDSIWFLMQELFPKFRCLCGPSFRESIEIIGAQVPLNQLNYKSGSKINGWVLPNEYSVTEAWVRDLKSGEIVINVEDHPYHLALYSNPFNGVLKREELLKHIFVCESLEDAIPLRHFYNKNEWGFCVTKHQRAMLSSPEYEVNVKTIHKEGFLTIGEYYLPGMSDKEIVVTSYLCHPHGANDNLSGVVVAVELFKLLSKLKSRKYSYRLLLNPETFGTIAWLNSFDTRLEKIIGGFEISICGDNQPLRYFKSTSRGVEIDRASSLAIADQTRVIEPKFSESGCDFAQFNAPNFRLPFGRWTRANMEGYDEYHTSKDDLNVVNSSHLYDTLSKIWKSILIMEFNEVYCPNYRGLPSMDSLGVYPYHLYPTGGKNLNEKVAAYYELLGMADGESDLIEISNKTGIDIFHFLDPVRDFTEKKLLHIR